jgi:hypothetical protein
MVEITPELAKRIMAEVDDPLAEQLTESPKMRPYIDFFAAQMKGKGVEAATRVLADLDLKDRYIWRIASALQWAFADFDSETARLDWSCISEDQRKQVSAAFQFRLVQMALLVKALYGPDELNQQIQTSIKFTDSLTDYGPFGLASAKMDGNGHSA